MRRINEDSLKTWKKCSFIKKKMRWGSCARFWHLSDMLRRKEKIKQKRRFSVPKTSYEERQTRGERRNFSRYLRVSPECFQRLFNVGVPFTTKQELQKLYTSKKTPYPYPSALPFVTWQTFVHNKHCAYLVKGINRGMWCIVYCTGPSLFTTTINWARVEADKFGICRVVKHVSFDWNNRQETYSHEVSKNLTQL